MGGGNFFMSVGTRVPSTKLKARLLSSLITTTPLHLTMLSSSHFLLAVLLIIGNIISNRGMVNAGHLHRKKFARNHSNNRSHHFASKNVHGRPLQPCSQAGMAKTGYTRSGQCIDQEGDTGSHHICINIQSTSSSGQDFCQVTKQGDWCSDDMPCQDDDGGDNNSSSQQLDNFNKEDDDNDNCPVENWCVCQWAFAGYIKDAGGCDAIQEIICEAVNIKALEAYQADEEKYGEALDCLKERCGLDDNDEVEGDVEVDAEVMIAMV